jgi:hypothetical protein
MACHRLARVPLVGATRGTRIALYFAPVAYAAVWDVSPVPTAPPASPSRRVGSAPRSPTPTPPLPPLFPQFPVLFPSRFPWAFNEFNRSCSVSLRALGI